MTFFHPCHALQPSPVNPSGFERRLFMISKRDIILRFNELEQRFHIFRDCHSDFLLEPVTDDSLENLNVSVNELVECYYKLLRDLLE